MALSVYPRAIPTFPTHRNLLDDVDANHINNIQRELTSVASYLGVNPAMYNDRITERVVTTETPGDTGGVDGESSFSGLPRAYDPRIEVIDHGSVAARLDYIQGGLQNHSFTLRASTLDVSSGSTSFSGTPKTVRFPKPTTKNDPFDLFSGAGVNLRKSGFYMFHAYAVYTLSGSTSAENNGHYLGAVAHNGNWVESVDRRYVSGTSEPQTFSAILMGFFNRGDVIKMRVGQDSGRSQRIRVARLSGMMIRESRGD